MDMPQAVTAAMQWAMICNFFVPKLLGALLMNNYIGRFQLTAKIKSGIAFVAFTIVSLGSALLEGVKLQNFADYRNLAFVVITGAITGYSAHRGIWKHQEDAVIEEQVNTMMGVSN